MDIADIISDMICKTQLDSSLSLISSPMLANDTFHCARLEMSAQTPWLQLKLWNEMKMKWLTTNYRPGIVQEIEFHCTRQEMVITLFAEFAVPRTSPTFHGTFLKEVRVGHHIKDIIFFTSVLWTTINLTSVSSTPFCTVLKDWFRD